MAPRHLAEFMKSSSTERNPSSFSVRDRFVLDESFAVVTLAMPEVVDRSMTSPAPIEAPVQRRGLYEHDSI
jgi:hypothetical protein